MENGGRVGSSTYLHTLIIKIVNQDFPLLVSFLLAVSMVVMSGGGDGKGIHVEKRVEKGVNDEREAVERGLIDFACLFVGKHKKVTVGRVQRWI